MGKKEKERNENGGTKDTVRFEVYFLGWFRREAPSGKFLIIYFFGGRGRTLHVLYILSAMHCFLWKEREREKKKSAYW